MDIYSDERWRILPGNLRTGFLDDFPASRLRDGGVFEFHMPSGQQPTIQPAMVDQENGFKCWMKNQSRRSDMAWDKLRT